MGNKMVKKVKAAGSYIRFGETLKFQKILWQTRAQKANSHLPGAEKVRKGGPLPNWQEGSWVNREGVFL